MFPGSCYRNDWSSGDSSDTPDSSQFLDRCTSDTYDDTVDRPGEKNKVSVTFYDFTKG